MSKKSTPNSFDDSKLPKGHLSLKRSVEIDKLMENKVKALKTQLREKAGSLKPKEASDPTK